jgi:phage terminase large subunit
MAASSREIVLDYAPRRAFMPYHTRSKRWAVIVAHRRCGKTVACINELIKAAITQDREDGRYAYIAPLYNQAKDVAWQYLKKYAAPLLASPPNESELRVDLVNGSRIRLYGADNPDRLRGIYLDGVVLDEYADMSPSIWGEVIRPLLADRKGWATFIGTPKGRNSFYDMYMRATKADSNWFSLSLKASETGLLDAAELTEAAQDMTPEQYAQEFECSFDAAIIGAYYGKEIANAEREGRITAVKWEPEIPVHTAWDLGIGDSTAIWWWQMVGHEIHIIDHHEATGQGLDYYAKVIHSKPYVRGKDFVPHDAKVRELGTGRTRIETMFSMGLKPIIAPEVSLMDGINAARITMAKCYFDQVNTFRGVEALRQYRADFDDKKNVFKDTPRHDWTSHSADAFRYMALAWRKVAKPEPVKSGPKFKPMFELTYNELFDVVNTTEGNGLSRV